MFNKPRRKYLHNIENLIFSIIIVIGIISFIVNLIDSLLEKEYKITCYDAANQIILQHDIIGKPEVKDNKISLIPIGEDRINYIILDKIYSCRIDK